MSGNPKMDDASKKNKLELIKALNSKVRLRALLFLFIYEKLSLTELSGKLEKTKNTTIYHMKMLSALGLINEHDEKIPNSIKPAKYYVLDSNYVQSVFQPFEDPENLPDHEVMDFSKNVFKWNTIFFETIRELLSTLGNYFIDSEKSLKDPQSAIDFHKNHATPRDIIPLSKAGYQFYLEQYAKLMEKTIQFLENEAKENHETIHPYLVFNTILPIKNLVESKKK